MAILNATPDSFSDGGVHLDPSRAADGAERFVAEGADVLDVGGESTRPGAPSIPDDEQIRRVVPVIRAIRSRPSTATAPMTIDTTSAVVAQVALDAGADAINDVSGATADPHMLDLAARTGAGLVLMHRLTTPGRDSYSDRYAAPPAYDDVVGTVGAFLAERARAAIDAGVDPGAIVLDPGLGFGKSVEQNAELIRRTAEIAAIGFPVLSGASRKSFVGRLATGRGDSPAAKRVGGSVGASVAHLLSGAIIFRVHDVGVQAHALRAAWSLMRAPVAPVRTQG